jgi:hypothetical protein
MAHEQMDIRVRYRVEFPLIALATRGSHRSAITIPEGATMYLIGPAPDDPRFLCVELGEEQIEVFEKDFANKCLAIRSRRAMAASTSPRA